MDLFYVDDAQQKRPSRPGMGPLFAIGGIHVPGEFVQQLENGIEALCVKYGFPHHENFKWSPSKELWMYKNLVGERRRNFLTGVLGLAKDNGAKAIVIIEDTKFAKATRAKSREIDLIQLFIERAHHQLTSRQCGGMIIVSQPGGDRKDENKFLASCVETLEAGTDYVKPDNIIHVICSQPRFIRLLQVADVVTSCTTAFVSGEYSFSPSVFNEIKSILATELGRIGGVGLKLHPDYRYLNLYHWLLGDSYFFRLMESWSMPLLSRPYSSDPLIP